MHIPKTGGMSMRMFLESQYHREDVFPASRWQEALGHEEKLGRYPLVRGHFRYNFRELVGEDRPTLVLLREPIRRTVSALRHAQRDAQFDPHHETMRGLALAEILRRPELMRSQQDVQARFLCASIPAADVSARLRRELPGNKRADAANHEGPPQLGLAQRRLESIDYLGLTEDIGAVMSAMAATMHYHSVQDVPFVNEDPAPDDTLERLTDEDLAILREHNALDLQLYEFAQRLIERRRLTEKRREVQGEGAVAPAGSFEIPLADITPGWGWYSFERDDHHGWRWTGPDHYFTIEVPLRKDASYRLIVECLGMRPLDQVDLKVTVDGMPVVSGIRADGNKYSFDVVCPRALLARSSAFCCIRFDLGSTMQATPPDRRLLGVSVSRIAFECV